ncbi:MAG TPA: hypothetical protein VKZ50_06740 [bacterium]|nr:hypothetical protein [bacterium]
MAAITARTTRLPRLGAPPGSVGVVSHMTLLNLLYRLCDVRLLKRLACAGDGFPGTLV